MAQAVSGGDSLGCEVTVPCVYGGDSPGCDVTVPCVYGGDSLGSSAWLLPPCRCSGRANSSLRSSDNALFASFLRSSLVSCIISLLPAPGPCTTSQCRFAIRQFPALGPCTASQCRFAIRQPLQGLCGVLKEGGTSSRAILNHVTVSMSALSESRTVRAILNHGDVPQGAYMALLRVRGAII